MLTSKHQPGSSVVKKQCPFCCKLAVLASYKIINGEKVILLECGHSTIEKLETTDEKFVMKSLSGKEAFPFQYKTNDFMINAGHRAGIFHEQGVGKTIISLMPVKQFPDKFLPFAVICKSSLKVQWMKEIIEWTGVVANPIMSGSDKPFPEVFKAWVISYDMVPRIDWLKDVGIKYLIIDECQQIKNSQSKRTKALRELVSGLDRVKIKRIDNPTLTSRERITTIANDLMKYHGVSGRFKLSFENIGAKKLGLCECHATKEGIIEGKITINEKHAKTDTEDEIIETILHEIAHAITPGAGHKPIWRETALAIGSTGEQYAWCNGTTETITEFDAPAYVVALSGTPIKNHAGEYFPILNMLHPEIFYSEAAFQRDYLDTYYTGYSYKVGGIKSWRVDDFNEKTKDFIIRYTRDEVLPDLPRIFRKNLFTELGKEVEAAYTKAYLEFRDEYIQSESQNGNRFAEQGNLFAKLNRLRHITGVAKIQPVCDFVEEFLDDNERKIVLFVHHLAVGQGLFNKLANICQEKKIMAPLRLTSDMDGMVSTRIDERFKNDPEARIMIASTLSTGEGKNWQMCSDMVMVEHQWNPANEEQCEGRFPRPGSTAESISATYAIALGTPDEYLVKIKEQKREICKKTLGNEAVAWNQSEVIKELCEMLISSGGKPWGL